MVWCRSYRAFYILNWIYKYFTEHQYRQWIGVSCSPARQQLNNFRPAEQSHAHLMCAACVVLQTSGNKISQPLVACG